MVNCKRCKRLEQRTDPCCHCITELNNKYLRDAGIKFTLDNPKLKYWWESHAEICSNPDNCLKELTRRYG